MPLPAPSSQPLSTPNHVDPKRLDGNAVATLTRNQVAARVHALKTQYGSTPGLTVILVGEDPASQVYTRKKVSIANDVGIRSTLLTFPEAMTQDALLAEISRLNTDPTVDGILVQLPLPKQIDTQCVLEAIDPSKDVDGFHPMNVGKLTSGLPVVAKPCTPAGVMTQAL
jgi:methylenetetrahydrofolate dehydrogenase (NADP+) / methenyltetrahydrofolate cyclohydrolase